MKAASNTTSTRGAVLLFLFALPFAGIGVLGLWLAAADVSAWLQARGWQAVSARLLEVDLEEHAGDDGSTYRVVARYRYTWNGTAYTGSRVALSEMADNVGSFHRDAYRELSAHRDRDEPFVAWVDPDDPARAVLYRQIRWGLLALKAVFGVVFAIAGFGLMAVAVVGRRRLQRREELRARQPEAPWLWRPEWASGRIPSGGRDALVGAAALAIIWNLISAPLLAFVPAEIADGNYAAALALVFPLVGIGLAWMAVREAVQWRRFGESILELTSLPTPPGGELLGTLHAAVPHTADLAPRLRLTCSRTVTTGSGRNRSTRKHILWQEERRLSGGDVQPGPGGIVIPVRMPIPSDAEATTPESGDGAIDWKLDVAIELPGVDYDAAFEVPVFPVAGFEPAGEARESVADGPVEPPTTDVHARGIDVHPRADGGVRVDIARARHPLVAAGLGLFTLVWAGAVIALAYSDAPLVFPVVFGLFLALLLWALWDLALVRRSISAGADGLRVTRAVLGPGRERHLPADRIRRLETHRGMQAGSRLYWRVRAVDAAGDKHELVTQLESLGAARDLVRLLEWALGRPQEPTGGDASANRSYAA